MKRILLASCILALTACADAPSTTPSGNAVRVSSSSGFEVIHVFKRRRDGVAPIGNLLSLANELYGTTHSGGRSESGTVFQISELADKVLYRFHGSTDGARPYSGLINLKGLLYGTTEAGGLHNKGTVYSISPSGSETVLWSFNGKDGEDPRANVTGVTGTFYGTTYSGGKNGKGTFFAMSPAGGDETVLHDFTGGKDGAMPVGTLIAFYASPVYIYGTTSSGGNSNKGTVFVVPDFGSRSVYVIYSFQGGLDGATPLAGLLLGDDLNFYGTTAYGGTYNKGTVFVISPTGSETVLHSFGGKGDGAEPHSGLTELNGQFYGTTAYGGTGGGTIYTITPSGTEAVVHDFTGGSGGREPYATLITFADALYGTTKGVPGTVFRYTP